jgi:hypothetical protein
LQVAVAVVVVVEQTLVIKVVLVAELKAKTATVHTIQKKNFEVAEAHKHLQVKQVVVIDTV